MMKPVAVLLMLGVLILAGPDKSAAVPPESDDPIIIILNNWTSQIILSKITGTIFRGMGYDVDYITMGSNEQWGGLNRGKVHVQVEVWEGTVARMFRRMIAAGGVVDAGNHDAVTREDWWYPMYVERLCPGLPDWRALKQCYGIFAVPSTTPQGRYLAGPWEKPDRARIRALGLNFKVVELKHGDQLRDELDSAVRKREPILLFNWDPNWVSAVYQGRFVEFPEYAPECETDPEWGLNPEFHQDCGNPRQAWLKKAAWSGMSRKWPCAFRTLKNIVFTNEMIVALVKMVDVEHISYDVAASTWIRQNRAIWNSWVACSREGES